MPFPCRSPTALIHTCPAATLPFSDSAVSLVKVRVVDRNILTASLFLVTPFVELLVVAGISRTRAGRPHAVSGRPMLNHTHHAVPKRLSCRAVPWPWEVVFRTAWSWHGRGTAWCVWISVKTATRLQDIDRNRLQHVSETSITVDSKSVAVHVKILLLVKIVAFSLETAHEINKVWTITDRSCQLCSAHIS
jgi:hypothetical protein